MIQTATRRFATLVGTLLVAVLVLSGMAWAATTPLAVTKTVPATNATGVSKTANVKAYFNHDMKTSTITSSTFKIRKQGTTTWLGATRSVNNTISPTSANGSSQSVATLNPNSDLAADSTYQVVIVGGSSGVKDVNGNALSANKSWTFTTVMPPETTIDPTTGPTGTVASDSASFAFSSSKPNSTFQCSLDNSAFAGCTSPKSYSGLTQGLHNFRVRAIDASGITDQTPASRDWTVDTVAPDTGITAKPNDPSNNASPSFSFTSTEANSTFECSIDGGSYSTCTSPKSLSTLGDGSHTFLVRAKDAAGNADQSPAGYTWTVDTVAPNTSIDSKPDGLTNSTSASFDFSSSEQNSTFECKLDGGAFEACTSPKSYSGLSDGSHTFSVRAKDAAGNSEDTPATYTWTVDTVAPDTNITAKPNDPSNSASPSFSFTSPEANSTFECKLDGGAFEACTSPKSYSGLSVGSHTFSVRAKDAAGNIDPTPASYTWTVNAAVPTVTFTPEDTTDVAPNTNVRATFSEAMNEASVETQGTFTLKAEGSSTPVEATVTYNSSTKSATLDPGTDLALNTTYTATLTTEAKDLAGNALAQERTWTFKTANAPRNVTVTPATLDFGTIVGSGFNCPSRTLTLTVTNNSSYDVTYGGVSITGTPSGRYFVTGLETFIRQNGSGTQLPGDHFSDQVTIIPSGNQTYNQTLTYLDDTGAPIGNSVALKAKSECISVG